MKQTNYESKTNKKKLLIIFCCIALVFAIIASAVLFLYDISDRYPLGIVTNISLKAKNSDEIELKIKYVLPSGGYSVREVSEDEGEYIGDGMIDYDGAIGKYRIMIDFGDVDLAKSFAAKMDENGVISLTKDIRASVAKPSDHGFVLYIGSNTPMNVETVEKGELDLIGGTIRIPITFEDR